MTQDTKAAGGGDPYVWIDPWASVAAAERMCADTVVLEQILAIKRDGQPLVVEASEVVRFMRENWKP